MDHSMHHSMDMGHGGMDHGNMCNMNMLFTWDTNNLCIVFRSWRVTGTMSLIWSLFGVVLLTAGYELVREMSRRYEAGAQKEIQLPNNTAEESSSLLWPGRDASQAEQKSKIIKALFYAVQVFYSFFIMLLFMTYNGWIMLAVGVGAFVGYLVFGNATATKSAACH
ncbi:hypothetical protein MBLNU459_g4624t2 [Dothideomycetes sp. NU459]